jgi:hypothetical protein
MSIEAVSLIVAMVSALLAALAVGVTWYTWKRQTDVQQQVNSEEKLNAFLMETYVLRSYAWSVQVKEHDFVTERSKVRQAFIADSRNWEQELDAQLVNRAVPEMAHCLQQIGLSTFLGAVPLPLVFAVIGDDIVLDWLIVQPHIAQLNEKQPILSRKNTRTPVLAKRRHAEWLATIAYLWLNSNWDCRNLHGGILQRMLEKIPKSELVKRVKDITYADADLLSTSTTDSVKRLINISLHHLHHYR